MQDTPLLISGLIDHAALVHPNVIVLMSFGCIAFGCLMSSIRFRGWVHLG
jgi:hypothetical protein